jgi:hypothetical protein
MFSRTRKFITKHPAVLMDAGMLVVSAAVCVVGVSGMLHQRDRNIRKQQKAAFAREVEFDRLVRTLRPEEVLTVIKNIKNIKNTEKSRKAGFAEEK